jgi:type I restriction enzyme S subunit
VAKAEPPGVVTGRYGTIGEVFFVEEPYWPLNTALYVVDFKGNDPRFVAYFLRNTLRNYRSEKAAVPGVDRNVLHQLKVHVPDKSIQGRIASVLSAYDDLIENNRQRIGLLEAAARMLYREWFVFFRFPGHEHVNFVDGLPEGWSIRPIHELAEILRGRSYSSDELTEEGGQAFVNLKCIERFGGFRVSGLKGFKGEHKAQHRASPGDIVIAVTDMTRDARIVSQAARIPKVVGADAIFSMDLVKAVAKEGVETEWLYGMLRYSTFASEVREQATGATVLHLKPKHVENWRAVVPPPMLRSLFASYLRDFLEQTDNLELQIRSATDARDLLLPRLMNGGIAV